MRLKKVDNRAKGECSSAKCSHTSTIIHEPEGAEFCWDHWVKYCEETTPAPREKDNKQDGKRRRKGRRGTSRDGWFATHVQAFTEANSVPRQDDQNG